MGHWLGVSELGPRMQVCSSSLLYGRISQFVDLIRLWSELGLQTYDMEGTNHLLTSIMVPPAELAPMPQSTGDDLEDWQDAVDRLFEWSGLACLHSQR